MATGNRARSPRSRLASQWPPLADVATMTGVSSQAVSRVANNRENVDSATREKALSDMQALGYRPSTAARALVTGRFGALILATHL
ncbi:MULTISPECIES: LacI family DNA-binding transcriptional regulator [Streptomyces]|uniref:HTH lacI-type domain-containing protein n=1 Tax=Streptomyces viridochromogenes TaxID=1938 RepID=A0A0L8LCY3_STRVR|nr:MULTISPECIES: LacI family DNA-binding transcriptional regulator [Streptomyces]KOG35886.1 hypothetical protein ADK34_03925 [Streptomyces viridochromogenes]